MRKLTLLIVDDQPDVVRSFTEILSEQGYEVAGATSAQQARAAAGTRFFDLLLLDERMPGMTGTDFLIECRRLYPGIHAVFITGNATVESAVRAMRSGALDLLTKPVDKDVLIAAVQRALHASQLTREHRYIVDDISRKTSFAEIIARSESMKVVLDLVKRLIPTSVPVLIQGESGTGKELLARAIHFEGPRKGRPFIAVNSAAIAQGLMESLLFGHRKGAFTGATEGQRGFFEAAQGGTIFLDEIGDMTLDAQSRLLRVLEQKTVTRVGETSEIPVDVRIVAATNRNLPAAIRAGTFREDLYHRLNVVRVEVPPLRDRQEDIELLAPYFLHRHQREMGKSVPSIDPAALRKLVAYPWPGNVRELSNVLQHALILVDDGQAITVNSIVLDDPSHSIPPGKSDYYEHPWEQAKREFAQEYFRLLVSRNGGNVTEAAKEAGVDRGVVYSHLKKSP